MHRAKIWGLVSVAFAALLASGALGQETTTYTYDELGRLNTSTISGGPNTGIQSSTQFDPAGNRTKYLVTGAPTPTPSPTPTPTPNQPPVAVADAVSVLCGTGGTINLTANDADPENNIPLILQSVTFVSGKPATASVISSSSVSFMTTVKGISIFSYVVADSLGATSTGQFTVTGTGNALQCAQ